MSRIGKVYAIAAIALVGLGVAAVYPPAGVAVSFVGFFMATFKALKFNVAATRFAVNMALLCNAVTIYLASGSPGLMLAALFGGLSLLPVPLVLSRWRNLHDFQPAVGLLLSLPFAMVGFARAASGDWSWTAITPNLLANLLLVVFLVKGRKAGFDALARAKIKVGEPLPQFKLPYRDGEGEFDVASERGGFLLLVFVRGDWCPVCHVMMRVINKERDTLAKHNVKLYLITPSEGAVDDEFASNLGIETHMLLDRGAAQAGSLGLLDLNQYEGTDVPLPVALLVDSQGVLRDITRPDDVTAYASERKIRKVIEAHSAAA